MDPLCVPGDGDIHNYQRISFEGVLAEEILGPPAVGAGGLHEQHHPPRLDVAVHKLLGRAGGLHPGGEPPGQVPLRSKNGGPSASWPSFKGTSLEEEFAQLASPAWFLKGQPHSHYTLR